MIPTHLDQHNDTGKTCSSEQSLLQSLFLKSLAATHNPAVAAIAVTAAAVTAATAPTITATITATAAAVTAAPLLPLNHLERL